MRLRVLCVGATLLSVAACAPTVEISRAVSPEQAAKIRSTPSVEIAAVVHQGERVAVPKGARIAAAGSDNGFRVVWSGTGDFVYALQPGDVIQEDEEQRIVGVVTKTREIHFVPGTASSLEGSQDVRGKLENEGGSNEISLAPGDRIEMHGSFAPGDVVPFGGHVETSRITGALVGGLLLFAAAYAPSAYVGATSPQNFDRALLAPVVGPWIDFATRAKCVPPAGSQALPIDPCVEDKAARIAIVISGAAQSLGTVLMLIGLPSHAVYSADDERAASRSTHWMIVPTGNGAAVVGSF
jgi:hypothetical protein